MIKRLKLQPFLFSASDLRTIAHAAAPCNDGTTKLVALIEQIHRFRDADSEFLTPIEKDYFTRLSAKIEADVSLTLYLCLLNSGKVNDGYLDLEALAQRCHYIYS